MKKLLMIGLLIGMLVISGCASNDIINQTFIFKDISHCDYKGRTGNTCWLYKNETMDIEWKTHIEFGDKLLIFQP